LEIYTLEISFPYNDDDKPWSRIIEIEEIATFQRLHVYIQDLVEFDDDHLYEFYIGKNPRNRSCSIKITQN
jgi:hypothetical protein